ncbi:DUF4835 family protein [bacterium]|nr:DUF4835 family protein [bacterium]
MRILRKWPVPIPAVAAVLCFFAFKASSQDIEPTVTLTLERLPLEKQEKLRDFGDVLERYIRDFDWTGEPLDEALTVTLSIQLQEASTSFEDRYSGTIMISNNSDLQYYDKYWRFPYAPETPVDHTSIYHPLTGFIDFFIYILLGGEYDKLGPLMGTGYYEKARLIADQAAFDAQFSTGWKERTEFIHELMGEENRPFREMKDRYYLGLSYMGENDAMVKKYCLEAIGLLEKVLNENPDHKDALNFTKAHHLEIIEIFEDQPEVLQRMIDLDKERAETYRKYMP